MATTRDIEVTDLGSNISFLIKAKGNYNFSALCEKESGNCSEFKASSIR